MLLNVLQITFNGCNVTSITFYLQPFFVRNIFPLRKKSPMASTSTPSTKAAQPTLGARSRALRLTRMQEMIRDHGPTPLSRIADVLGVTEMTVRRDLAGED
jgi:hypothetical protein